MRHLQRRAAHLLNLIQHTRYDELCELLGGWRNDLWVELAYGHGEPTVKSPEAWLFVDGEPHDQGAYHYGLVRRIHFDFDWHNYVLAQVWDHNADDPTWEFVLFHNTGENEWVPSQVWSWGDYCPSNGEAGAIVDEIEMLRHEL